MVVFVACAAPLDDDAEVAGLDSFEALEASLCDLPEAARGLQLFAFETFGGNDRTCATCHMIPSAFALSPDDVQTEYMINRRGPLFRSIDSNDGVGNDYSMMLADANARVAITCAPNVTIDEVGPNVTILPDGRYQVVLRRSTPSVMNMAFEDHLMWDGREGDDLAHQAGSAVRSHFGIARAPTAREAQAIATFQRSVFSRRSLATYAAGGPPPTLPPGTTPAEQRGRNFFVDGPRGLCAMCHGGPILNTINRFNPFDPVGTRFATNFSSELNALDLPEYTFRITMPDGSVRVRRSSDPGRSLVTGNPCENPAVCLVNPGSFASVFKIPSLWGVRYTAPYFHDNSAADFEELLVHYQQFFHVTAVGLAQLGFPDPESFEISDQDAADIIAYLRLL